MEGGALVSGTGTSMKEDPQQCLYLPPCKSQNNKKQPSVNQEVGSLGGDQAWRVEPS